MNGGVSLMQDSSPSVSAPPFPKVQRRVNGEHLIDKFPVYAPKLKVPIDSLKAAAPKLCNPKTYLDGLATALLDRLSSDEIAALVKFVQAHPIDLATLCSGSECPVLAMEAISRALEVHGQFKVEHVMSSEKSAPKRDFIRAMFPDLKYLFGDLNELTRGPSKNYAELALDGKPTLMNPPDFTGLAAGFPCTDVSSMNPNAMHNRKTVEAKVGATGSAFAGICDLLKDKVEESADTYHDHIRRSQDKVYNGRNGLRMHLPIMNNTWPVCRIEF
jgi:hypothetical protein